MRWMQRYGDLDSIGNCKAFSRLVGKTDRQTVAKD